MSALVALQQGGADIIEVGVPFSDPMADGGTIQRANTAALASGMDLGAVLQLIRDARAAGVTVPIVMMGYINPMLAYGLERCASDCKAAGVDGFIVVDAPPEEARSTGLMDVCAKHGLDYVPLVAPTSTDERIADLAKSSTSFIYCVSVAGVTGARSALPTDLNAFLERIRKHTAQPLAVGFGISKREHVLDVQSFGADGVVVGSAIVAALESAGPDASPAERAAKIKAYVSDMTGGGGEGPGANCATEGVQANKSSHAANPTQEFSSKTHYGEFGGRYIPETLVAAHEELEAEFEKAMADPKFIKQLAFLRKQYIGGPTPLYFAERFTKLCGGADIWMKREELAHTGAHKINNALGQVLLAQRIGKTRIIAETGAGQHGVATATACALLDIECVVYMGAVDVLRQSLNVFRMKILGASVVPVESGSRTLKDAVNEAMRDWVTNVSNTHYVIGSAVGPHPFPMIVRDFQKVIGIEARQQMLDQAGKLPDTIVACVGGGSNAIGLFHPFIDDDVEILGVEAGGETGPVKEADGTFSGRHSATITGGTPGVLHGMRTYLIQDRDGQIEETHSISAGLDYPGVGPEHAWLAASGRAKYVFVTDDQAMEGLQALSRAEGIIPALEPAHAVYAVMQVSAQAARP